jgi:hypothetical protein
MVTKGGEGKRYRKPRAWENEPIRDPHHEFCARAHRSDEKGALLAWRDDISSWSNNDGYFHSIVTF